MIPEITCSISLFIFSGVRIEAILIPDTYPKCSLFNLGLSFVFVYTYQEHAHTSSVFDTETTATILIDTWHTPEPSGTRPTFRHHLGKKNSSEPQNHRNPMNAIICFAG